MGDRDRDGRPLVLTNDDGIDAPGLAALVAATEGLGWRRVVVAPAGPYSSCSHTITTHRPLAIGRRADGWVAVEGAPADCVRMALHHLATDLRCVVAGINAGGNLGSDVYHSGTVAAAREAVLHGRPGIAVSQYLVRGRPVDWDQAARWTSGVLRSLLARSWEPRTLWNVNLPHPEPGGPEPEVVECPLDPSPLPLEFRLEDQGERAHYAGNYHQRRRVPGSDVDVCFSGHIAVTLLRLG
jgi:5'-nucleotidase